MKYQKMIMNNVQQSITQANKTKYIGQQSELWNKFVKTNPNGTGKEFLDWQKNGNNPLLKEGLKRADAKTNEALIALKQTIEAMLEEGNHGSAYLEETIEKTAIGMSAEARVLKREAGRLGKDYKKSTSKDEARGIDGRIGGVTYSVKPKTYYDTYRSDTIHADKQLYYWTDSDGNLQYDERR